MRKYYKYKMNLTIGNIMSILFLILACIPAKGIIEEFIENASIKYFALIMLLYLFWIALHEVLHGIGHIINGVKINKTSFGAAIEKGVLFCLIRKEVSKKDILISLIFPFFFIGIVTYIIGMIIDNPTLVILSIFNISGASVDLLMFYNFMKLDKDITYIEPGDGTSFYLMSNNLKNKKLFGLDLIEEGTYSEDMFKGKKYKVFDISKTSYLFFSIMLIVIGLIIFL